MQIGKVDHYQSSNRTEIFGFGFGSVRLNISKVSSSSVRFLTLVLGLFKSTNLPEIKITTKAIVSRYVGINPIDIFMIEVELT